MTMPANSTAAAARRRGRPARFAACQAIQGYVKLEAIQGRVPDAPSPDRRRQCVPSNLRTAAEIAAWAQNILREEQEAEARRHNPDNGKVRLASGDDIELGSLRKLVADLHNLGLNAFFKLDKVTDRAYAGRPGHYENREITYIVDVILCPATATPDWRRMPARIQNSFEQTVCFLDGKLTNGTEYVKLTFFN